LSIARRPSDFASSVIFGNALRPNSLSFGFALFIASFALFRNAFCPILATFLNTSLIPEPL
jgi:hypothetical protein